MIRAGLRQKVPPCARANGSELRKMPQTRVLPVFLLALLVTPARPQTPEQFRISVSVDLVVLPVTVHDRKGRAVTDLTEQDFEVYEEGVRQPLRLFRHDDSPVTLGLVVDHSGSMRRKLEDVVAAARTLIEASNPQDQMFVVNFNEKVMKGLPPPFMFTDRMDEMTRAIANAPTTGQTALYDAAAEAFQHLEKGGPEKKALILISDGGDNASVRSLGEIVKIAERSSALVYSIGIFDEGDPDRNPDVLRKLARIGGGEAFFPSKSSDIRGICEQIAREIRIQYTLGYVSTAVARPGAFRGIKVTARSAASGKLTVRTRAGYLTAGAP
jgi:Ca-activated chloride channel family protein